VDWPGRFQTVVPAPLTIVDGAHNASAARALAGTVQECLAGCRVTLVLGMSEDKDSSAFIATMAPIVDRVVVTRARHSRSTDPGLLREACERSGICAEVVPAPGAAVRRAWDGLPSNGAVLVTGSLFLVGDVMEWLLGMGEDGLERSDT
jgi:dihydrofolate synthase / folylpolyglutamate synthase